MSSECYLKRRLATDGSAFMQQCDAGSVTYWLRELRGGNENAAFSLWSRYFFKVAQFARGRICGLFLRAADEEDVAASVIQSVFEGIAEGRFPQLVDRDELWKLLIAITKQKSADLIRRESRQKRGNGTVRDEQSLVINDALHSRLSDVLSNHSAPDALVAMQEELDRLLALLDNEMHSRTAVMRIQGYSNSEIAKVLNRTERTVQRWVDIVRRTWELEMQNGAN